MPRKGSPYGPEYVRERANLLRRAHICVHCGLRRATEADHQPPLSTHSHRNRSGCCQLVPSCGRCAREQGAALAGMAGVRVATSSTRDDVEPEGVPADDPVWRVPWLADLLDVPDIATWPRYMTVPHPQATGSYGAQAAAWIEAELGIVLRWWQRLALTRELEHDESGRLVWLTVLSTTSRQSGKSTKLRGGAAWRMHQAALFGERQEVLHTGKDLPVCRQVIRPMMTWAEGRGYDVRRQNGNEEIATGDDPDTASRWIVRGKGSVYGYSGTSAMVDEAWGVQTEVVDDGILPTMLERQSPQLLLTSTGHRKATMLFPARRLQALAQLREPRRTLLLEWSARRDADLGDRAAWRAASPHWGPTREDIITDAYERVLRGEMFADDLDDDDPAEAFRAQFLNVWPLHGVPRGGGDPLLEDGVWLGVAGDVGEAVPVSLAVAVEDNFGHGAAVATVVTLADDRRVVSGWVRDSRVDALADAEAVIADATVPAELVVSVGITTDLHAQRMGMAEIRRGLSLLRSLIADGRIIRDDAPDLDDQLAALRVREAPDGLTLAASQRCDVVRALAWALRAAEDSAGVPAIF